MFRHLDKAESVEELDSMAQTGAQFYKESGNLLKLAGVLRATEILWNTEKRQVMPMLSFKLTSVRNP